MAPFHLVARVLGAFLTMTPASLAWCQATVVPDAAPGAVPALGIVAAPPVSPRPVTLNFVEDQKPKRVEVLKTLDHAERLTAVIAALEESKKSTTIVMSGDAPPPPSRPAALPWTPDDFGDVSMNPDPNRPTMKAEAR
jgi:hypothetical protein